MRAIVVAAALAAAGTAAAEGWYEPARGSAERGALMDAFRPHAEWVFGAPVEFVVSTLRVADGRALAHLSAQRPGGAPIDIAATPGFARGEIYEDPGIPTEIQVLYKLSGQTWVAVHWAFGATDVWYAWGPFCAEYRAVISDVCP